MFNEETLGKQLRLYKVKKKITKRKYTNILIVVIWEVE